MTRYIDADKFAARIKASPIFPNMGQDGYFLQEFVLDLIDRTADVAPKSEVAKQVAKQKAMFLDVIDTFRNLLCIESYLDYEDTRKHYSVSIDDVNRIHDELKKKYTEGTNEN